MRDKNEESMLAADRLSLLVSSYMYGPRKRGFIYGKEKMTEDKE